MAAPQVAGVVAKYLSADNTMSSAEVTARLTNYATVGVLDGVDGGFNPNDPANRSPNLLVFGDCTP